MEFVKEFATFLFEKGAIKFGDFTLASGKKSPYYIDLRLVSSFPHEFRKMIKNLQNEIIENIGLDSFDSFVSVPTGGLVMASALAIETVKPLIYVRSKPKDYGTSKSIEGYVNPGMKVLMIDDVATTGSSIVKAIKILKQDNIEIKDAYVCVDRMEGAHESLEVEGVKLHQLTDIMEITKILYEKKLISNEVNLKIKDRIDSN